jgi:hypothetical protein
MKNIIYVGNSHKTYLSKYKSFFEKAGIQNYLLISVNVLAPGFGSGSGSRRA